MFSSKTRHIKILFRSRVLSLITANNKTSGICINFIQPTRGKKNGDVNISSLFQPVPIKKNPDDINIGAELTSSLNKEDLIGVIKKFSRKKQTIALAEEHGLDKYLWEKAISSFQRYCLEETLPVDLHVIISDILQDARHVTDIFPYFMRHAKEIFPHLDCLDDLKKISDLRTPANWYPLARSLTRKIIFHAGPTNSGKTYHALERFMTAESGVYCGPLKLLAVEVFEKSNANGTPCDLLTGEEKKYAIDEKNPAKHIACTVEMMPLNAQYEVAVIDEIQLMRDVQRGWAWTRALLGIPANEVHLCGEAAAIDLVELLCSTTGERVEVRKYKRLTELHLEDEALCNINNIRPGDCIVCFSKHDIYTLAQKLEKKNVEVAVIYGSLPPGTKLAQAAKFNDVNHPCKVLIATDAIGMGLNLHIRRLIFYSLVKPTINNKGEKQMDFISVPSALQIAGRAGRYGTQWEKGYVTTYKPADLPKLKNLLSQTPEIITQAGLHPTADQIELYAYHLPKTPLSSLIDIFVSLCTLDDSMYFICNISDFKFLADVIEHVPLPLRARYVFCCAPINRKMPFVCTMFLKYARQYCKNEPITFNWLCLNIGWPLKPPATVIDLVHLEAVFDVLDLYLWLSYRFADLFPEANIVQDMQKELDAIIQESMQHLTRFLKSTGKISAALEAADEDNFELSAQKHNYLREKPEVDALSDNFGQGKLSEKLLTQGLITRSMLQQLHDEWTERNNSKTPRQSSRKKLSRKPT